MSRTPEPTTAATPLSLRPGMVGALSVAQMMSWGTNFYGFTVLMVPLEQSFAASRTEVNMAQTLAMLAGGAAALLAARWMQHGFHQRMMTGGSALSALGFAVMALAPNLATVYLAWILIGMAGAAVLYTPAFVLLTRVYPQDFRAKITTLTLLGGIASTVFWPLMSTVIALYGWRACCGMVAGMHVLIGCTIHWRWVPSAAALGATSDAKAYAQAPALSQQQKRIAWCIAGYIMLESLAQAAIAAHMIEILRSRGLSLGTAVAIGSSFGVIQTLARGSALSLGQRVAPSIFARSAVLITPISICLLLVATGLPWLALCFALLFGMGNGLSTIVRATVVTDLIGANQMARLSGYLDMGRALSSAIGPTLAAVLYTSGGYNLVLAAVLLAFISSASLVWLAWRGFSRASMAKK